MKMIKRLVVATIALIAIAGSASAQLTFGVKVGAKINDLNFKSERYEDAINTGFTGGLMLEYMFPSSNLGIDAALMYFYVKTSFDNFANTTIKKAVNYDTHFIQLPINFKWKIGLPIARDVVTPYLTTGPSFSIIGGERQVAVNSIRYNTAVIDWNIGLGAELFDKFQVGVNYGMGLTNSFQTFGFKGQWTDIDCKINSWTISAAYMF